MTVDPAPETPEQQVRRVAGMFDTVAEFYDQSGVPFFGPIAQGLVSHLAPRPGERALDVGAGRGAVTFRLAEAVGRTGRVDALDISPEMVRRTAEAAQQRGLDQVSVFVGDATDPRVESAAYDLVASSLVLFFMPDPAAALRRWVERVRPGGRIGVATFRPLTQTWQAIVDLFGEYATDPTPSSQMPEVFHTDAGVAGLMVDAGGREVRTEGATYSVPFEDVEQWRRWSLGSAMRGLWLRVPEETHPEILQRVAGILDHTEDAEGGLRLEVDVRYTLARA